MVYKLFDKMSASFSDKTAKGGGTNNTIKQNEQLEEELHKTIIEKFLKRRVYSSIKDNIWSDDLADMQLISKFDKGTRSLNIHVLFL